MKKEGRIIEVRLSGGERRLVNSANLAEKSRAAPEAASQAGIDARPGQPRLIFGMSLDELATYIAAQQHDLLGQDHE